MVLGFTAHVLEDGLFPVAFHMIPVVYHTVSDGVVNAIGLCISDGLVADVEIEVFDAAFGGEMTGFRGQGWTGT